MKKTVLLLAFVLFILSSFAREGKDDRIVLLKPTGNYVDEYPEMQVFANTSYESQQVQEIIASSAVKDILDIYYISQVYLKNLGRAETVEPAYLALTDNQGGYAKKGFYILTPAGDHIDHSQTQYVDIMLNRLLSEYAGLMSFTQLFPHELAHVIYSNISLNDSVDPEYRNVDMHYFPVITDYNTAFNEGFAEHLENISRILETNTEIRTGIQKDLDKIEKRSGQQKRGYINDFKYPVRIGYYKSSIIYWFQKYEDARRYTEALDASIKYLHTSPVLRNVEDRLSIRNAGIMFSERHRNIVQAMATEGLISAFFTHLITSQLPEIYAEPSFYFPFMDELSDTLNSPRENFSPYQNQFIKYFYVIHNFVSKWNTDKVQLADFIQGYCITFPDEALIIKEVFKEVSGREFTHELPPQIWLMVKKHHHRVLAIDPFGAITFPVYTFDLNAAEEEDLQTIKGLSRRDIGLLIEHRENKGFFNKLEDVGLVEGISENAIGLILDCTFDKEYMNAIPEPQLSFSAIINTPIWRLVYRIMAYAIVFLLILNLFLFRGKGLKIRSRLWISVKYFLLWLFYSILSLGILLFVPNPILSVSILSAGLLILTIIWFIHKPENMTRSLIMISAMILIVGLSVV